MELREKKNVFLLKNEKLLFVYKIESQNTIVNGILNSFSDLAGTG